MKVRIWPANGRVVYIDDHGKLGRVVPAVGTVLPSFSLMVLADCARANGVVELSSDQRTA